MSADGYGELLLRQADGRARWFEGSPTVSLDESTPGGEDVQFHSGLAPVQDDGFRRVDVLQGGDQILRALGPSCNESMARVCGGFFSALTDDSLSGGACRRSASRGLSLSLSTARWRGGSETVRRKSTTVLLPGRRCNW